MFYKLGRVLLPAKFKNEESMQKLNQKLLSLALFVIVSFTFGTKQAAAKQQKDFGLSISPDGKYMVYYSYRGNELPDLFVSDIDGNGERKLTDTKDVWEIVPSWSIDGQRIIFSAGPSMKDLELFSVRPDGSERRQITDGEGNAFNPSSHPSRNGVIYSRFIGDDKSSIYYIDLASGKEFQLSPTDSYRYISAVFSPDGEKIAFVRSEIKEGKEGKGKIGVTDPHFTESRMLSTADHAPQMLTWTPDGKSLIFSDGYQGSKNDLFKVDINSSDVTRLTDIQDEHIYFSTFSPDGQYVYMDKGDWSQNFFVYKAKWTGQALNLVQVGGRNWIDTVAVMEQQFLAPMIGMWKGVSTHGSAKGRFEEVVEYKWGPNKKSILVDMTLYWDGNKFGDAKGLLGLDRETQKVYYNLVMDDGTVVMQQQINPGESAKWVMDVVATGDGSRFLNKFRVEYFRNKDGSWKSDILKPSKNEWQLMDVHEFTKMK